MINEGRIELRLEWRENRAHGVTLNYRRAVEVRRLLEGCEPQRVPLLVGALFGICRRAQGLTAEAACGAAAGRECRPDLPTRRAVVAELAREHLRRLLLDWPRCLGLSPWPEACRQACAALERDAAEGSMTLAPLLRRLLLEGGDPGDAPADGVAARLESVLGEAGLCGLGAVELAPLSGAALTATVPPDGPRETGPLLRQVDQPLVGAAIAEHGRGLLARILARVAELLRVPEWLAAGRIDLSVARPAPGVGVAALETARGLLAHRVEVRGGRIADYRLWAPTDWNLHPDGLVVRGLRGRRVSDRAALRRSAECVVLAADPCVPYVIEVTDA